jgi:hypothetical protein
MLTPKQKLFTTKVASGSSQSQAYWDVYSNAGGELGLVSMPQQGSERSAEDPI